MRSPAQDQCSQGDAGVGDAVNVVNAPSSGVPSLKDVPVLEGDDLSVDCSWLCCTMAKSESWELQLSKMSSELKMKLKDPHFVAKRCDLDSSGDLDMHELKQAARAFGLQFSLEKLQQLMAGEARISKERFAQIVADAPCFPSQK